VTLYRHRHRVQWTNTERFLLRGAGDLFSSVAIEALVGSRDWFSQALSPDNFHVSALGQVSLQGRGAQLNWLLSTERAGSDPLPRLLDHLAQEAGIRGARFITAGARLEDCLFESLRRAGYCVYGWQSFWRDIPEKVLNFQGYAGRWRKTSEADAPVLESLQRQWLAPSVQSVSQFAGSRRPDFLLQDENGVQGYALIECFNDAVLVKPLLSRDLPEPEGTLASLMNTLLSGAQTVWIAQTSDQAWLTKSLHGIAEPFLPREELLVKHFTVRERLPASEVNHAQNGRRAEPLSPIIPSTKSGKNL
jgi:hypothetical protein